MTSIITSDDRLPHQQSGAGPIDYTVDQSNKNKWAGILGANNDITSRWSLMIEYSGFFGSKKSIFASIGRRF